MKKTIRLLSIMVIFLLVGSALADNKEIASEDVSLTGVSPISCSEFDGQSPFLVVQNNPCPSGYLNCYVT